MRPRSVGGGHDTRRVEDAPDGSRRPAVPRNAPSSVLIAIASTGSSCRGRGRRRRLGERSSPRSPVRTSPPAATTAPIGRRLPERARRCLAAVCRATRVSSTPGPPTSAPSRASGSCRCSSGRSLGLKARRRSPTGSIGCARYGPPVRGGAPSTRPKNRAALEASGGRGTHSSGSASCSWAGRGGTSGQLVERSLGRPHQLVGAAPDRPADACGEALTVSSMPNPVTEQVSALWSRTTTWCRTHSHRLVALVGDEGVSGTLAERPAPPWPRPWPCCGRGRPGAWSCIGVI